MKRTEMPVLSATGLAQLSHYYQYLQDEKDFSVSTLRNYQSDLRQFAAWCETTWAAGQEIGHAFEPSLVATPLLTRYRTFLQTSLKLKPASVNRYLVSVKGYFTWVTHIGLLERDPARVVKLIPKEAQPPRHLEDNEETALLAAVMTSGTLRDRTIITLMLHTGLRASETCTLKREQLKLGKRSGAVEIIGKRNKYREVPLNATVRAALAEYLPTLEQTVSYLFPSSKTGLALTERALAQLIEKYATLAKLKNVSSHDLRHRFGYRMAKSVPLHRLAQIMGHDSLDTTLIYIKGTRADLQQEVEKIAWH